METATTQERIDRWNHGRVFGREDATVSIQFQTESINFPDWLAYIFINLSSQNSLELPSRHCPLLDFSVSPDCYSFIVVFTEPQAPWPETTGWPTVAPLSRFSPEMQWMVPLCNMVTWSALSTRMALTAPGCTSTAAAFMPADVAVTEKRPVQGKTVWLALRSSRSCEVSNASGPKVLNQRFKLKQ